MPDMTAASPACPVCHSAVWAEPGGWRCGACPAWWPEVDGIGRFLAPDRAAYFDGFLRDYTTIRLAEGRALADPAHYRALPEVPVSNPLHGQWRMRGISWRAVQRHVLRDRGLRVLDVGAGVGWLSNRLVEAGHEAVAIDLSVDDHDGLGAARHYTVAFPRRQAEMDALPAADGSFDLVVFNASIHYADDLERTLREAVRVLAPRGRIVVMDSPIYDREADGEAMVRERADDFAERFGTRSDSVASIGFLTPERLRVAGAAVGLRWTTHRVWYGWRWAWRPWRNRLRGRRAPSRFAVLVAVRAGG
ncbi:MAG: hypothetical protein RL238_2500 [Actinomycetota bacterium]|jgi:SAM-dependent methyltransferase